MNINYSINKNFKMKGVIYTVTFEITDIRQDCIYDDFGNKKYEVVILFNDSKNKYDGEYWIYSKTFISFEEIYNQWCKYCYRLLREEGDISWWDCQGVVLNSKEYDEMNEIIEKEFHNK